MWINNRGNKNFMKLNNNQINEIKELRNSGITQMSLAIKYEVSIGTIAYHTNEKHRLRQIRYSTNNFKNLPTEKKQQIYLKRKDYLIEYKKRKKDENKKDV
jgi:hypothetical protein